MTPDEIVARIEDGTPSSLSMRPVATGNAVIALARPGSAAATRAHTDLAEAERAVERISSALGVRPLRPIRLFLYDSLQELRRLTFRHATRGLALGFDVHVRAGDLDVQCHELAHVVAIAFHPAFTHGGAWGEGLAHALTETIDGHHLHVWAGAALVRGQLPSLPELMRITSSRELAARPGWYEFAGSFVRFLLDEAGPDDLQRIVDSDLAHGISSEAWEHLERSWHSLLLRTPGACRVGGSNDRSLLRLREPGRAAGERHRWQDRFEWGAPSPIGASARPPSGTWPAGVPHGDTWGVRVAVRSASKNPWVEFRAEGELLLRAARRGIETRIGAQDERHEARFSFLPDTVYEFVLLAARDAIGLWVEGVLVDRGHLRPTCGEVVVRFGVGCSGAVQALVPRHET